MRNLHAGLLAIIIIIIIITMIVFTIITIIIIIIIIIIQIVTKTFLPNHSLYSAMYTINGYFK